ncbi:hypothetical protein C7974DRAFT_61809 [Boeremia exigua]|uniref:uncharacterized protein n=1 Tax=Boeremia exigua TaxID=749465 RepID=UPI001E8DFAA6|nr:uncharacterized protein C7974DRAFT_61809 [Boeremia exigua]KAH6615255.1 hypothetical protein C7974DRAFT_61809 [Boeremia exigua]
MQGQVGWLACMYWWVAADGGEYLSPHDSNARTPDTTMQSQVPQSSTCDLRRDLFEESQICFDLKLQRPPTVPNHDHVQRGSMVWYCCTCGDGPMETSYISSCHSCQHLMYSNCSVESVDECVSSSELGRTCLTISVGRW